MASSASGEVVSARRESVQHQPLERNPERAPVAPTRPEGTAFDLDGHRAPRRHAAAQVEGPRPPLVRDVPSEDRATGHAKREIGAAGWRPADHDVERFWWRQISRSGHAGSGVAVRPAKIHAVASVLAKVKAFQRNPGLGRDASIQQVRTYAVIGRHGMTEVDLQTGTINDERLHHVGSTRERRRRHLV